MLAAARTPRRFTLFLPLDKVDAFDGRILRLSSGSRALKATVTVFLINTLIRTRNKTHILTPPLLFCADDFKL